MSASASRTADLTSLDPLLFLASQTARSERKRGREHN
jgi:hypothetical protein